MLKSSSMDETDLGLGDGLQPGSLPPASEEIQEQTFTMLVHTPAILSRTRSKSQDGSHSDPSSPNQAVSGKSRTRLMDKIRKIKTRKTSLDNSSSNTVLCNGNDTNNCEETNHPLYAEIPLGTSIRQQRELFHRELNDMLGQHSYSAGGMLNHKGLLLLF